MSRMINNHREKRLEKTITDVYKFCCCWKRLLSQESQQYKHVFTHTLQLTPNTHVQIKTNQTLMAILYCWISSSGLKKCICVNSYLNRTLHKQSQQSSHHKELCELRPTPLAFHHDLNHRRSSCFLYSIRFLIEVLFLQAYVEVSLESKPSTIYWSLIIITFKCGKAGSASGRLQIMLHALLCRHSQRDNSHTPWTHWTHWTHV